MNAHRRVAQMSKQLNTSNEIVALVHSIAALGNNKTHAIYNYKGKPKYQPREADVTTEVVKAHLAGEQPIGCYFVLGDTCQVAVIDFDDHKNP